MGIYGVLRIPGHPLDLSIGGRRRYPQDTAVSSGYHRYPLRIPSVSSQDTIGILRIPSVSSGYHRYPGVENTRYYPQDTAGILGIR